MIRLRNSTNETKLKTQLSRHPEGLDWTKYKVTADSSLEKSLETMKKSSTLSRSKDLH